MASVALAIERAAPRTVDGSLWWDSHRELLEDLEEFFVVDNGGEDKEEIVERRLHKQDELERRLQRHRNWLLNMLLCFKTPNPVSREALNGSKIMIGSHTIDIKPELKTAAIEISKHLDLDEVQSFLLLTRVVDEENSALSSEDSFLLQNAMMTYFLERQCLLKCTRLLLILQSAGGTSAYVEVMSKKVQELIRDGLEEKGLENLKHILSSVQPQQWDPMYGDPWADETAIEQTLLMDVLFLTYYDSLCVCKGSKWKELLRMFQELVFEARNGERLAVTHEAEKMVRHVRNQALLILIETLDLHSLLILVHGEIPFSQGSHAFSLEELQELDALVSSLDPCVAPEYAPLLLAWATFLCLVSALPDQGMVLDIEHVVYAQQAYKCGAYGFLLGILRSEPFKDPDVQVGGYKGVVKTLTAACLAAYDFASQADNDMHNELVEILSEAYDGQETLCTEFWDKENAIDGPIRSLLYTLRDHFPYQMLPLLRLLSSLCEGSWPAECVYNFLYKMVPITCLYRPNQEERYGTTVYTSAAVQIPNCSGLYIPAGAAGHILSNYNDGIALVRWECEHSGLVVLLVYMAQWPRDNIDEVISIIILLNRLLSSNKGLSQLILNLDKSMAATCARMDGRMDKALSIDVISIICSVIENLPGNFRELQAIADSINLLQKFVYSCPSQVITNLGRTGLIGAESSNGMSGELADHNLQIKFAKFEQSCGRYPVTVAVLDIGIALLQKGTRLEPLSSFVLYVTHNLLVNHGNWKYRERHQRWLVSTKIFQILQIVASRPIWYTDSVRRVVLDAVSNDSIIHGVLFQILTVNAQSLEELNFNRLVHVFEIDCLLQAICAAMELIDTMLLHLLDENTAKDPSGVSIFSQSLFQKATSSASFISTVASYLGFHRSNELQVLSARVLGRLCEIGQKARPQSINVASYISNVEMRKQLRNFLEKILSEKCAFEEPALFDAVVNFLVIAVKWQPAVVELLLFPWEDPEARMSTEDKASDKKHPSSEVLDALWKLLTTSMVFSKRYMEILARLLLFLASLWKGGTEYLTVIRAFQNYNDFWDVLSSRVVELLHSEDTDVPSQEEALIHAFGYRCQASIYQIMAHDMFMQCHLIYPEAADARGNGARSSDDKILRLGSSGDYGPRKVLSDWSASSQIKAILQCYLISEYREELILHVKAEVRTFVVGLLVKLLSGDDRGVDVSFLRRLCEYSSQILLHPSFKELLKQYASRGYRYTESLDLLVMSDLYYNLQGELDGRKISNEYFQEISKFLSDLELDMALVPVSKTLVEEDSAYGEGPYDVRALRSSLGLDSWDQNGQVVTTKAAEKVLYNLERANGIICLGDSQLSAVDAFTDLMKIFSADKQVTKQSKTRLTAPSGFWTLVTLSSSTEEICSGLERAVASTGLSDRALYLPKFLASQSRLFFAVVWQFVIFPAVGSEEQDRFWGTCARAVRTSFGCMKFILDSQQVNDEAVKNLFGCLLMSLEVMCSRKMLRADRPNAITGDAFVDVTLVGLGFLPLLCSTVEIKEYSCFSLATINILIRGFLATSTWLPILQDHFPTKSLVSRMAAGNAEDEKTCSVIMKFCLYLSRFRSAAEMLFGAGFLHYLLVVNHQLDGANSIANEEGPFSTSKARSLDQSLWALGVAIVASMLRALAEIEAYRTSILETGVAYFRGEKQRILSALCAPDIYVDSRGRKMVKCQRPQATSTSLQETQYVVALLCELVRHRVAVVHYIEDDLVEVREMVVHLLAYIAREGVVRNVIDGGVSCPPLQKQEIMAHSRPSMMGSTSAWFLISARGSSTNKKQPLTPGNQIVSSAGTISHTEYSEFIAVQVYKIVNLLLRFLLIQVQQAIQDMEEGRATGIKGFPELPASEILHALQDQVMLVACEIATSKAGTTLVQEVVDTCCMLFGILEKSLYLEACVSRIYGITPVSLRADDFARQYKTLLLATEKHQSLESSLAALKEVAPLVYPGVC